MNKMQAKLKRILFEPMVPLLIAIVLLGIEGVANNFETFSFVKSWIWANGSSSHRISSRTSSDSSVNKDTLSTSQFLLEKNDPTSQNFSEVLPLPIANPIVIESERPLAQNASEDANAKPLDVKTVNEVNNSEAVKIATEEKNSVVKEDEPPSADSDAYKIRAGDVVDVFVWGQENISGQSRVARDGSIVVKLAGSVKIEGLTVDQAAYRIRQRLQKYLIEPAVTVSIPEFGGKDVVAVGEVDAPGAFRIDRPTRLLDILIMSKWNHERADLSAVTVARGTQTIICDVASVLRGQRIDQNILMEPGDLVIVPGMGQTISMLGAFNKTGKLVFPKSRILRVRDVLSEGNTWTAKANIASAFILRQDGTVTPCNINKLWFQGDAREDKILNNGDALVIPELSEIGVYVLGKVGSPGLFTRSGSFSLLQALTLANPSTFHARLYDVRIVRGWPDNPRVYRVNVKALLDGDLSQNMMLEGGDVIFVPEGVISYSLQFWNQILAPIAGTASTIYDINNLENTR